MEKSSESPKVSIIIPTYNSGNTLEKCLKSVQAQSYSVYEVIVVDNFSSDATINTARKFGAITLRRKCSPTLARNIGIENSTGKYILFIDSDQVLSPSIIEECIRKCEDEKAGMVRIPEVFIGNDFWSSCSAVWKNFYFGVEKVYEGNKTIMTGEPRFFVKECLVQVGMLDESLMWGEDYDLHKRMRAMSVNEGSCKSKLYHYEPTISKILVKNLQYGKSMPIFFQRTEKRIFLRMVTHAFLTFRAVLRNFRQHPSVIVGCTFLLFLKTCSIVVGLFTGSLD